MAYSPYLPRTPQASRGNASAPSTPRLGQGLEYNHPSHRYASRLVHHDSNSESSFGFASPAHKSVQSYGTVQTDISNNTYVLQSKGKVVVELSTPSDESTRSIKTLCKPIAWIWVVINVTISGMTVFCLLQPYWLTNQNNKASLGILRYCEGLTAGSNDLQNCQYYQTDHTNNFALNTLPSLAWKVGMVMYIIACLLLIISSFLAGLCLCIRKTKTVDRLSLASGLKQLTAGTSRTQLSPNPRKMVI